MKLSMIAVALVLASSAAMANTHTVALGVQSDKIENGRAGGVNLSYDFVPTDSAIGVTVSGSVTGTSIEDTEGNKLADVSKYSLLVGPNFHIAGPVSGYVLAGVARGTIKAASDTADDNGNDVSGHKSSFNGFAYGVGLKADVWKGVSVRVGYEGTKLDGTKINGVNLGVGYSF